jgi:FkbM family methyltransferase
MERNAGKTWLPGALLAPVQALKQFTYNPRLLAVARYCHLNNTLRKAYQWMTGGKHNILRVDLGRFEVLFQVHSPLEYRTTEQYFVSYERDFIDALLSSLSEGEVFLDVGSSIGQFTVPLAKALGTSGLVIAVEPEVGACVQLEENLRLNGCSNVRILRVGLGDEPGQGSLSWADGRCPSLLSRSVENVASPAAPSATGEVEVVAVEVCDQLMEREHLPIPAAVKIDVEGYEYHVIRGMRRTLQNPSCRLICCEIHPAFLPGGTTPQIIIEEVKSIGFTDMELKERSGQIHLVARKQPSQRGR